LEVGLSGFSIFILFLYKSLEFCADYFISVLLLCYSYAGLGGDACKTGQPEPWGDYAIPFVEVSTGNAGPRYLKAQYNEYTDDTFTTKKVRSEDDAYMGILGPVIRAEVGDTVDVSFKFLNFFFEKFFPPFSF
jgi:hephaestin